MSAARDLDARREALLRRIDATPVNGAAMAGAVILVTEGAPAILARWSSIPKALALVGLALAAQTIVDVEQVASDGHVPLLTLIEGHVFVNALRLQPLGRGGDA